MTRLAHVVAVVQRNTRSRHRTRALSCSLHTSSFSTNSGCPLQVAASQIGNRARRKAEWRIFFYLGRVLGLLFCIPAHHGNTGVERLVVPDVWNRHGLASVVITIDKRTAAANIAGEQGMRPRRIDGLLYLCLWRYCHKHLSITLQSELLSRLQRLLAALCRARCRLHGRLRFSAFSVSYRHYTEAASPSPY